ncbi:hypothetical protein [Xylanimonas protaetiae]|uniref:Secreted protein n=1 Tax=Xylanimonas protaetiae TaxID=2509457 RepID=A0A4P6FE95_9MICO|nr:hypothetical protein [Xylanimonas protaetiae]QAY68928.1 hypothetical protein ET471_01775 [Xylanimonas protaetiae]
MRRQLTRSIIVSGSLLVAAAPLSACAGLLAGGAGAPTESAPASSEPAAQPDEWASSVPSDPASPEPATSAPASLEPAPAQSIVASSGPTAPETTESRKPVTAIAIGTLASEDVVSAGGFVQDAIEAGGTCTFTLSQDDRTVTGASEAEADATVTWCANVDLALPEPGKAWTLELSYESPMSVGAGSVTSDGTQH